MSLTTLQPDSIATEIEVEPESSANYTPQYREFFERLRRARVAKGLSIADMAGEVGLTFKLAHEFETLAAPLPFEWLEVWCQIVGVPFADYLAVYWASEKAYSETKEREREVQEREDTQNAPCISSTEATATALGASETPIASSNRAFSWLAPPRAAFDRIANFFRSLS